MELMQFEMFVAVVEEGSVQGASERVFRTQPAVSIAIKKLEEELGVALFDRSKRHNYRLTQAGETMFTYARRMLILRDETVAALKDICNLCSGRLRIGANESISLHLLPRILEAFLKRHAGVRMEVLCERSESLVADLRDRKLDVALLSFKPENNDLESKFITRDELVLVTHPNHSLARKENVHIRDLSEESLLVMDVSQPSPWHRNIADAFVHFDAPLHLTMENAPIETIKKMVALGLGVGFVPLMSVREEQERKELAVIDAVNFHQERSVWLVRRRTVPSPAVKAFAEIASEFGTDLCSQGRDPLPENKLTFARHKRARIRVEDSAAVRTVRRAHACEVSTRLLHPKTLPIRTPRKSCSSEDCL
jgi:LysR family transcriptional regulator, low CO2-responsive transcriptional regulator